MEFIKKVVVIGGLIVMGTMVWGAFVTTPQTVDPSKGSIDMLQPCRVQFLCAGMNEHNAKDVNLPNSQSNLNNGMANNYNAQATATVKKAQTDYMNSAAGTQGTFNAGFLGGSCITGFVAIVLAIGGTWAFFKFVVRTGSA